VRPDVKDAQEDKFMFMSDDFFVTGPFASASCSRQAFTDSLYFSYLLNNSLEQRGEIEKAHLKALEDNDIDLALKKKTELDYLDGVFKLTLEIQPFDGGIDS
jgi:hypothetical protein